MKNPTLSFVVVMLISVSVFSQATSSFGAESSKAGNHFSPRHAAETSLEEKTVRAGYDKLSRLNRAYRLIKDPNATPGEDEFLRFELSNFKVGPITEIVNSAVAKLKTQGGGEIIELSRVVTQNNKEQEYVAFAAKWVTDQWAAITDRKFTVQDLFNHYPHQYSSVGEYALYDVRVWFEGKSRRYRSLALFRNPYGSNEQLDPVIWDSVVGSAWSLTEIWNEQRPAVGDMPKGANRHQQRGTTKPRSAIGLSILPAVWTGKPSVKGLVAADNSDVSETYSVSAGTGDQVTNATSDRTERSSGSHGEEVTFRGYCSTFTFTAILSRRSRRFVRLGKRQRHQPLL